MSFVASIGPLPLGLFVLGAGKRLPARRRNGVPWYAARGDFHWSRARPGTYARGGHPSLYPVSNGLTSFAALLERENRADGVEGEGLQRERIPRIGRQALRLRQPDLIAYDIRAQHHRDHLVLRVAAAHAFASHPAIGGDHDPLGGKDQARLRLVDALYGPEPDRTPTARPPCPSSARREIHCSSLRNQLLLRLRDMP